MALPKREAGGPKIGYSRLNRFHVLRQKSMLFLHVDKDRIFLYSQAGIRTGFSKGRARLQPTSQTDNQLSKIKLKKVLSQVAIQVKGYIAFFEIINSGNLENFGIIFCSVSGFCRVTT